MINTSGPESIRSIIVICFAVYLLAEGASADCIRDLSGEAYCGAGRCVIDRSGKAWCSRHFLGDAAITLEGQVLCGRGKCTKNSSGKIFCSSEIGGAVLRDSRGQVRCYGKCEPGSADNCEHTRADSAGS